MEFFKHKIKCEIKLKLLTLSKHGLNIAQHPNRKFVIKPFNGYVYHTEDRGDMKSVLLKIMLPSYLFKLINYFPSLNRHVASFLKRGRILTSKNKKSLQKS